MMSTSKMCQAKKRVADVPQQFDVKLEIANAGEVIKTVSLRDSHVSARQLVLEMARVRGGKSPKLLLESDLLNLLDPMVSEGHLCTTSSETGKRRQRKVATYCSTDGGLKATSVTAFVGDGAMTI